MLHKRNEVKLSVRVEGYTIWKWLISHRTTCPCITFKIKSIFTERSVQHLFSRLADDGPQVVQERCRCGSGGGDVPWWNDTDTSESRSAQSEPAERDHRSWDDDCGATVIAWVTSLSPTSLVGGGGQRLTVSKVEARDMISEYVL